MPAETPKQVAAKDRERAQWNERFKPDHYWFGTDPTPFLAEQAHRLKPGMTALSIADGEGRNGVWLARQGLKVTTVDLCAVDQASPSRDGWPLRYGVAIETICADLEAWD